MDGRPLVAVIIAVCMVLSLKIIQYNMARLSFTGVLIVSFMIGLLGIVEGQVVPNGTTTALSNINMTQLLQSLNMTQNDLKQMQDQIAKNSSTSTSNPVNQQPITPPPPQSNTPQVQPTTNTTKTISNSQSNNLDSSEFMDLSSLEQQLGIRSNAVATATLSPQAKNSNSQPSSTQNTAATSSPNNTNAGSSGQVALQGPIPIATTSHLSTSSQTLSQVSSTLDFLDLSSLQKQLGLVPSTVSTSRLTNSSSQAGTQNAQQQTRAATATTPNNTTSIQNNSAVEIKPASTSTPLLTQPSNTSISATAPPTSSVPARLSPPSLNTLAPPANQTLLSPSLSTSNAPQSSNLVDQTAQLYSQLAKLQDLLDQLTNPRTTSSSNPTNSSPSKNISSNASNNTSNTTIVPDNQTLTSAINQSTGANLTSITPKNNQTIVSPTQQSKAGPINSSLPEMIDITKAKVIFSIYNSTQQLNSTTLSQQNTSTPPKVPQQSIQAAENKSSSVVATEPKGSTLPVKTETNGSSDNNSQVQVTSNVKESIQATSEQDQRNSLTISSAEKVINQLNKSSSTTKATDANTQAPESQFPGQPQNVHQTKPVSDSNQADNLPTVNLAKAQVVSTIYNNSQNPVPTANSPQSQVVVQKQPVTSTVQASSKQSGYKTIPEINTNNNLPPMIDITKANVIFSIYNQTSQNVTQPTSNPTQPTKDKPALQIITPSGAPDRAQTSNRASSTQKQPTSIAPSPQEPIKSRQDSTPAVAPTQQDLAPSRQKQPVPSSSNIPQQQKQASTVPTAPVNPTQSNAFNPAPGSNLPPVIDISKATVIYSIYNNSQSTSSSLSPPVSPQPKDSQANKSVPVSIKQQNLNSVTLIAPPNNSSTTSASASASSRPITSQTGRTQVPSTDVSKPTVSTIPSNWPYSVYPDVESFVRASAVSRLDPRFQSNQNIGSQSQIVQANIKQPTSSQAPTTTPSPVRTQNQAPSAPVTNNLQRQPQNSIQPSQYQLTSKLAVYTLRANYKTFSESFILSLTDLNLPRLQNYLAFNYANYIKQGTLIAGFKLYQDYDNSIQYQLLYSTVFGTFNAFINYNPYTDELILKSLSVISFPILDITLQNCLTPDSSKNNCQVCRSGYRNFMGRCRLLDVGCLQYLTDECGACMEGYQLIKGRCSK